MVRLNINGVEFSHGSKKVLNNISFSINNGEVIGILGQNGSGKTTLLNCINTEYKPTHGTVTVLDFSEDLTDSKLESDGSVDVTKMSDMERSRIISTVEQNSSQSFPFTVMETVRMGRYSRTGIFDESDEEETRLICSIMEDVGILQFSDRSVNELSGGEWRRVMIAQALAQDPEILLLDEPTLHLDINHQFDLMDLCKKIVKEKNILVVVVTHDLQMAARYCDKVIIMEQGVIKSLGPATEVITKQMIKDVFHMNARISFDPEIEGISVLLLNKVKHTES